MDQGKKSAPCTTIRFGRSPAVAPTFPTYKTTIESVLILFLTVRYTFFCHTIFTNLILFFKKNSSKYEMYILFGTKRI
jgi:hypothetical protein